MNETGIATSRLRPEPEERFLEANLIETVEHMKSFEVLDRVIPRGKAAIVARQMHVSVDLVRRWTREPASNEEPNGTGFASPLDKVCDLTDICFLVNPVETALIPEFLSSHYRALRDIHNSGFNERSRVIAGAELLRQATAAINALAIDGSSDETLRELTVLRDTADAAIARVNKDLSTPPLRAV